MNENHCFKLGWRILRDAAWAPALVLFFRWSGVALGTRQQLDHLIHFSGGFAIAYFLYRCIGICARYLGNLIPLTRYLLAFTTSCAVALFWEFGEFASDIFLHSHIQHSLVETLYDLLFGVAGAFLSLGLIASVKLFRRNSDE